MGVSITRVIMFRGLFWGTPILEATERELPKEVIFFEKAILASGVHMGILVSGKYCLLCAKSKVLNRRIPRDV